VLILALHFVNRCCDPIKQSRSYNGRQRTTYDV